MASIIDRYYHYIRPFRFLYGWAKDGVTKLQCSARAEEWKAKGFKGAKLDVCGGRNPFKPGEFLNVDIVPMPKVDLVFDITKLFPIPSGVIAEVFSAATLEHIREHDVLHVMKEFHRVLMPGGVLRVSTPDIEAIAKGILAGDDLSTLQEHLFGKFKINDTEDYDVHRWMAPAPAVIAMLKETGFTDVERIPMDVGLHDAQYNFLIRARKP